MLIIVEGLDNTGKSTLVKNLRKHVFKDSRVTSIHCTSPPNSCHSDWSKDHYTNLLDACRSMVKSGWTIILDRSHLGEDVFGPMFRNENADFIYDLEYIFLYNLPVKAILLVDDPDKLIERDDGQSYTIQQQELQKVSDRFVEVFKKSNIRDKMVYNISNDGGFEQLLPTVENFILGES